MILPTKPFFSVLRTHYRLPPDARGADLRGRLAAMANPANAVRMRVDALTRLCLQLFLARRPPA